jgi:putative transposase
VLAGVGSEEDPIETVGRLGARLILQQALEDEVSEFLGRRRYERAGETVSHRNGHEPKTVKTTSGAMRLERPRIRDASRLGFESRILGKGVARTHALESLVISGFLRGLSTRDVEATLEEVFEEQVASKSTVSRICEDTRERYRQWCRRRLEQHDIVYLFLDAIYLKLRPDDTPSEGVLVCWGVTLEGRKILLGLALGSRESYEAWLAFGRDMIERGLRSPALVIADGAPGIWKATRELWPHALEQRCTVHALRNVTGKLPERATTRRSRRAGGKRSTRQGHRARRPASCRASSLTTARPIPRRWRSSKRTSRPSSRICGSHASHRKRIRTTNLLERTFVEVRRRTKVIGRFPGETSALSLIWAVLELSSRGWRGVKMNPKTVAEIERLRRQLREDPAPPVTVDAEEVIAA